MEITQEMIDYCNNTFPTQEITEPAWATPRVVEAIWNTEWGMISRKYEYVNPPESESNGLISNEIREWIND